VDFECNRWLQQLRSTMFAMTFAPNKTAVIFATVAALATLLASFWVFRWGFIHIWEGHHDGRRMVFVFGPDEKAGVLAILSSLAVFNLLRRLSSQRKP
jgi:hypothetical protein